MEKQNLFSVKSFYNGATKKHYLIQLEKRKRLKEKWKKEEEIKKYEVNSTYTYSSCFSERVVWKYFPRQQLALDYAIEKKEACLCLFAYEKEDGKRKFLVTTQNQFWCRYKLLEPCERHYYEVITKDTPCRLYFDIEYQYEFNSSLNGVEVLEIFLAYVCYCLYVEYGIECSRKDFVDLDSSSEKKFSRHVIFHMNNDETLFLNNQQCGEFVKEICSALNLYFVIKKSNKYLPVSETYLSNRDLLNDVLLERIFVNTESNKTFLCDLSVYTKNRNFRLYLSSKTAKKIPLIIANENQFVFKTQLTKLEREIYKIRNLKFDSDYEKFQATLICPYYDIRKTKTHLTFNQKGDVLQIKEQSSKSASSNNISSRRFEEGSINTDYPTLDRFVLSNVNKQGSKGRIRRWMLYQQSEMIIYDIDGNRYCHNINREHKSNHVYYVVDLKFKIMFQKCFDPDCFYYRSPGIDIPDDVNPFVENVIPKSESNLEALKTGNKNCTLKRPKVSENMSASFEEEYNINEKELEDIFNEEFDIRSAKKEKLKFTDLDDHKNINDNSLHIEQNIEDLFEEEFDILQNEKSETSQNVSDFKKILSPDNIKLEKCHSINKESGNKVPNLEDDLIGELFDDEFEIDQSAGTFNSSVDLF